MPRAFQHNCFVVPEPLFAKGLAHVLCLGSCGMEPKFTLSNSHTAVPCRTRIKAGQEIGIYVGVYTS